MSLFKELKRRNVIRVAAAALRDDTTATRELAQRMLESLPDDDFIRASFMYAVSQAYAIAGIEDEALDTLDAMLAEPGGRTEWYLAKDAYL